ncbi:Protein TRI1 [Spathaspora sp. JA1]|nr:Protein TRI1 [Spathaspora sp. JA1]
MAEITVKRIRNALQELFGVDLQPHKKDINELITSRYFLLLDKKDEEEEKIKREEMERKDALLAAKLSEAEYHGVGRRLRAVTDFKNGKRKQTKRKSPSGDKTNRSTTTGFHKEMVLSNDLESILGIKRCSRPQVVKQLWAYIKDHNLQNPEDKRLILCDAKLEHLFKKKSVSCFAMNKLLSSHIFRPEDINENSVSSGVSKSEDKDSGLEEIFSHDGQEQSSEEE